MSTVAMVIFLSAVLLAGDALVKQATVSKQYGLCVLAGVLWVASIPGWYYVVNGHRLAMTGAVFAVVSIVGTTLIGIFAFHEKICASEWLGLVLAVASMVLLARKI